MNLPRRTGRKGQPLLALALILLGWIGVRSVLWASSVEDLIYPAAPPAPTNDPSPQAVERQIVEQRGGNHDLAPTDPARRPMTVVPLGPDGEPLPRPTTSVSPRIAAGHRLLFLAGVAAIPAPSEERAMGLTAGIAPPLPTPGIFPPHPTTGSLWSADSWVLWRQGGNGYGEPGRGLPSTFPVAGAYGASQAGVVLRYRLAHHDPHRAALYLRANSGLNRPLDEELSAGFSLRPIPRLPLAVMGEVRASPAREKITVRPAGAVVTELPAVRFPAGLRGEVYGQAGWLGGKDPTPFIDGQARLDKRVGGLRDAEFGLGMGAWAGAQSGSSRIDMGPSLRLDLHVSGANARLTADYRWRVAGQAAPGSGAAMTFSAGF